MHPEEKTTQELRGILQKRGFDVVLSTHFSPEIEKVNGRVPDLIICNHGAEVESGFQIYNDLQPFLAEENIPFILYLPEFRKEDIMIGLELGIDSFIVSPPDELGVVKKIEHQLLKKEKGNFLDSEQFRNLFENSPVAKFIIENTQITLINQVFANLTGVKAESEDYPKISELFYFRESESNELNFKRCINGLRKCCTLKSVSLRENPSKRFDIHMVHKGDLQKNVFFCEMVPSVTKGVNEYTLFNPSLIIPVKVEENKRLLLTKREFEVLKLSSTGLEIKQIANKLGISSRTVEKHRANIMQKSKTGNIIEAINYFSNQEN
jgi:two-component system alkaline phosphatase synthesis response regulator PhoP